MEEDELIPMVGSIEAKDSYSAPPPGHSLTEDNSKWAYLTGCLKTLTL